MIIRKMTINDIEGLAVLMSHLGYQVIFKDMKARIAKIIKHDDYYTLVAELDGKLVGMAGLHRGLTYEYDEYHVRIMAFVVDENVRRQGVGKRLINAAEQWAIEQGASGVVLNSGNREERIIAHQFYQSMGYEKMSSDFVKRLIQL